MWFLSTDRLCRGDSNMNRQRRLKQLLSIFQFSCADICEHVGSLILGTQISFQTLSPHSRHTTLIPGTQPSFQAPSPHSRHSTLIPGTQLHITSTQNEISFGLRKVSGTCNSGNETRTRIQDFQLGPKTMAVINKSSRKWLTALQTKHG